MKQLNDANTLKVESQKNTLMIRRQKEAEMMKNASIKEMIRKQKMDATDRKEQVSGLWCASYLIFVLCLGNSRKEIAAAKSADQQHPGGK